MLGHGTYQRLWNTINPKQFLATFSEFVDSLQKVSREIISIDGKTIRNSGKEKPLHIASAWCHNNSMVFAQEKVRAKSNEITAISELLKKIDLQGKTIIIDATGAQKIFVIVLGNGDYVIALKKNQKNLFEDLELFLQDPADHKFTNENDDKDHGRIEQQIAMLSQDIAYTNGQD